jgi:hypothetical protein
MSKYLSSIKAYDFERFAVFHEQPTFLPESHIRGNVIPFILYSIVALTLLYNCIFALIQCYAPKSWSSFVKRKVSYQLTNLCVNAYLGVMGMYHYYLTIPPENEASIDEQVMGWESLYPIAALQIAYQLWAIRMGLFVVKESPAMIVHHVAVILASCMCAFLTIGFRFWTPFFFGIVEVSSVPLALMNTFKDHPVLIEQYPTFYHYVRLAFAFSFLAVRWTMFAPRQYTFLQQSMWAIRSSESYPYILFMSLVWLSSFFLWCLQVFWGTLIVKGLAVTFLFPKESKRAIK